MQEITLNDLATIIVLLTGSALGLVILFFIIFLTVLSMLAPWLIFLIHRSTRRTAIASEKIARQNEQLINLLEMKNDFSFGELDHNAME